MTLSVKQLRYFRRELNIGLKANAQSDTTISFSSWNNQFSVNPGAHSIFDNSWQGSSNLFGS